MYNKCVQWYLQTTTTDTLRHSGVKGDTKDVEQGTICQDTK